MSVRDDWRAATTGLVDLRRWRTGLAHPIRVLRATAGDGPLYALLVLFGLNMVDEFDRTAFGVLLPTIRDHFGLSDTGITSLIALSALAALLLQLPIAWWADRGSRVRLSVAGGVAWGVFSFFTGMANVVWVLVIMRMGSGVGRAVVDPTHSSLLADYFPVERRSSVFAFHRGANAVGQFIGPLAAGLLSEAFGWRVPFIVFAVPTAVLVVAALRLHEPVRGAQERRAAGMDHEAADVEEPSASFGESWRLVWKIESLRRIWYAIPFMAVSLIGFVSLAGLMYDRVYGLGDAERGLVAAITEPFQLIGLVVGARLGTMYLVKDPAAVFRFLRSVALVCAGWALLFAWAPVLWLTVVANIGLSTTLAVILPGILSALSVAIPARSRAVGFSVGSYWAIPGLAFVPMIGWISDNIGIRWGMSLVAPIIATGGLMISSVSRSIGRDIEDAWASSVTRSQALAARREGRAPLLVVSDLDVYYGRVQTLFGVSLTVEEGDVVALLGTNGAGKSTLLKAISGIVEADYGSVIYDGRDITHAPPDEIARAGIGHMSGGAAVFPGLTVDENLRMAAWTDRRDARRRAELVDGALAWFPALADRRGRRAAELSGGQQQMLGLAMNLLAAPRVLMIDELSLGLAPIVVEHLAALVREVADEGTTVIIVEQSVNVALTLAETAHFMEKGQIRYSGPTAELLDRPDLLRSVFLAAADGGLADAGTADHGRYDGTARRVPGEGPPVLALSGLGCSFGGIRAVDAVDLELADGEILGLIGPNGAGKTTLLDLVSGHTPADRGSVALGGIDIGALGPHRRARLGLGRSFQDAELFGSTTVAETIAIALDRHLVVRDPLNPLFRLPASVEMERSVRHRVDQLTEMVGLAYYRDAFLSELSTGTRRMVDLACAVAHRPSVLMLDEPSSGIAQREAEALVPVILRLRDDLGCAMIIVEHDMSLLFDVCDRLVALDAGTVMASGTPAEVLSTPAVIAAYLGSSDAVIARSGPRRDNRAGAPTGEPSEEMT